MAVISSKAARPAGFPGSSADPIFWSAKQVANYFGVCQQTVYRWRDQGIGPRVYKVGYRYRYRRDEVLSEEFATLR